MIEVCTLSNKCFWILNLQSCVCAGISLVPSEFPAQRPVTRSFNVFFDLRQNKRVRKQSWGWWFERPPSPLWRHCNDVRRHLQSSCPTLFQVLKRAIWSSTSHQWGISRNWCHPITPGIITSKCYHGEMQVTMMTSSNGNIFRITGPLWGEFTGHRWIPRTKASDAELWCFLWYAPWKNGWVNNREAGDLRRHRSHYDVIVMSTTDQ